MVLQKWQDAAEEGYTEYTGYGAHKDMLEGECAEKNANIILDILDKITSDQKMLPYKH